MTLAPCDVNILSSSLHWSLLLISARFWLVDETCLIFCQHRRKSLSPECWSCYSWNEMFCCQWPTQCVCHWKFEHNVFDRRPSWHFTNVRYSVMCSIVQAFTAVELTIRGLAHHSLWTQVLSCGKACSCWENSLLMLMRWSLKAASHFNCHPLCNNAKNN